MKLKTICLILFFTQSIFISDAQTVLKTIDLSNNLLDNINYDFKKDFKLVFINFTEEFKDIKISNADGNAYPKRLTPTNQSKTFEIRFKVSDNGITINDDTEPVLEKKLLFINKGTTLFQISSEEVDNVGDKKNTKIIKPTGYCLIDATAIMESDNIADCISILAHYFDIPKSTTTKELLLKFLDKEGNKFFKDEVVKALLASKKENDKINSIGKDENLFSKNTSSLLSGAGGLDVTNIADGFAKFVVKRTKQELSITFFKKFKDDLGKSKDIQTVFPQTYRALSAIDREIYMFEAYIQTLRESFEKDLASLPSNLPTIIENNKDYFDSMPELKATLQCAFYISEEIQNKQHPGDIIENFPSDDWKDIDPNFYASLQTLILLSSSLKTDKDEDAYWASSSEIKKLGSKEELLYIYLGLLEQKAKEEKIVFISKNNKTEELSKFIDASYDTIVPTKKFIKDFSSKVNSLEKKIQGLKHIERDSILFENYYSVICSSLDLMKFATNAKNLPFIPKDKLPQKLETLVDQYYDLAKTSADISIDINRRNYSSAVVNVVHLYDVVTNVVNVKIYVQKTSSQSDKESKGGMDKKIENYKQSFEKTASGFFKYGSFMAAMTQAKNSDEVEAVIESFALPTGSAMIKRETRFNVALNAYCGLFLGAEKIKGVDDWKLNTYGVAAPIGLSISRGHSFLFMRCKSTEFEQAQGWSSSIFLSLVDIGALTAFRFTNDSTKSVPKIQLKDIISPGIFLSLGIPKSPISLNLGWQAGPLLREVTKVKNDYSQNYSRFSVSVCVDLPMLNFYTKSK